MAAVIGNDDFRPSFFSIMSRTSSVSQTTHSKARVSAPVVESQGVSLQSPITARTTANSIPSLIESVTSKIDALLLNDQPSTLSLSLRFDKISLHDFDAILESPAYDRLLAHYSHMRTNYNSATQILIIRCMTTAVHDSPQSFISRTLYSDPHLQPLLDIMRVQCGTEYLHFNGRFKRSQKLPDVFVAIKGYYWPTLVVETGWSEDYDDLVEDAKLWLLGSPDGPPGGKKDLQLPVNVVILISFDKQNFEADSSTLKGYFEVWRRDPTDANAIKQDLSMQFYPTPPTGSTIVEFPLEEIVRAANVPPGVSGTTPIRFDLMLLVNLVEDAVIDVGMNLDEKRRINAEKREEAENATRISEQQKRQKTEEQTKERGKREENRSNRMAGTSG